MPRSYRAINRPSKGGGNPHGDVAHTGHPATPSRYAIEVAPKTVSVASFHHPQRGCRVPLPEVRNRGYSHPSGGRVRAVHAILRPRIPRNRPPNAQNRREGGFPGSNTAPGAPGPPGRPGDSARILTASPVATEFPARGCGEDRVGRIVRPRRGTPGGGGDGVRGVEHPAARRSCGGPENRGVRGGAAPASLRRGRTECGPKE